MNEYETYLFFYGCALSGLCSRNPNVLITADDLTDDAHTIAMQATERAREAQKLFPRTADCSGMAAPSDL